MQQKLHALKTLVTALVCFAKTFISSATGLWKRFFSVPQPQLIEVNSFKHAVGVPEAKPIASVITLLLNYFRQLHVRRLLRKLQPATDGGTLRFKKINMNRSLLLFKSLALAFLFVLVGFTAMAQSDAYTAAGLAKPTVTSDKDDYSPGEVAIITGTGWKLDSKVDIHFEETPVFHEEHQHDFHDITVDANGNWRIEYPIEMRHLGVAFDVHVVGQQTQFEATTTFTDGLQISGPTSACQGTSVTYTSNITNPDPQPNS
ncbi:MAG: hypothetical protein ACR2KB_00045, partial [Chitinophagaceae bacterium]